MKKLLALFVVGGLLSLITGCPNPTTGPTKKGDTSSTVKTSDTGHKRSTESTKKTTTGDGEMKKEETKKEETKKDEPKKEETKKEETKKEETKKDPKK